MYREKEVLTAPNLQEMINRTAQIPLMFQPGTSWYYSSAVDIQGHIVEKLTGKTLGQFMRERIFAPLKMSDTAFYTGADKASRLAAVYVYDRDQAKIIEAKTLFGVDMPDYTKPPVNESGGGGLVSTTHDYARFSQMMLNKGTLGGKQIIKPETVDLMVQNHIGDLRLYSDGTTANPGQPGIKFGLDFAIVDDPAAANSQQGKGTYYWGGAAGTWFWIDPANDLFFVGMIQRMGGARPDGMNFRPESAKLVYDALGVPPPAPAAAAGSGAPQ
jgi:CubicO group peptidase (beta-lactamase class C family)